MTLFKYVLRRIGQTLIVLFFVSVFAFFVVRLAPGNPVLMMVPDGSPQSVIDEMTTKMGLDKPLIEQYFIYIGNVLQLIFYILTESE